MEQQVKVKMAPQPPHKLEHMKWMRQRLFGIPIQQTWTALYMIESILNNNRDIKRIVELGTGNGALTRFFEQHMRNRQGKVLSIDQKNFMFSNAHLIAWLLKGNVFDGEILLEVQLFIKKHRALIFCDNGNKPKELQVYSKIAKQNDIIMAHDFLNFQTQSHCDYADIPSNCETYRQDEFDEMETLILCLRKL